MPRTIILASAVFASVTFGCNRGSNLVADCNQQAFEDCVHIAAEQCDLSLVASRSEVENCESFTICDDEAFDACIAHLGF